MKEEQIKDLLEKYWAAETSLEEEQMIRELYRSGKIPAVRENQVFGYFDSITEKKYQKELNFKPETRSGRFINMKFLLSIAASMIVMFCAVMLLHGNRDSNKVIVSDPDEAIEVTLAALDILNGSITKGETAVLKNLKQFEKTRVSIY